MADGRGRCVSGLDRSYHLPGEDFPHRYSVCTIVLQKGAHGLCTNTLGTNRGWADINFELPMQVQCVVLCDVSLNLTCLRNTTEIARLGI